MLKNENDPKSDTIEINAVLGEVKSIYKQLSDSYDSDKSKDKPDTAVTLYFTLFAAIYERLNVLKNEIVKKKTQVNENEILNYVSNTNEITEKISDLFNGYDNGLLKLIVIYNLVRDYISSDDGKKYLKLVEDDFQSFLSGNRNFGDNTIKVTVNLVAKNIDSAVNSELKSATSTFASAPTEIKKQVIDEKKKVPKSDKKTTNAKISEMDINILKQEKDFANKSNSEILKCIADDTKCYYDRGGLTGKSIGSSVKSLLGSSSIRKGVVALASSAFSNLVNSYTGYNSSSFLIPVTSMLLDSGIKKLANDKLCFVKYSVNNQFTFGNEFVNIMRKDEYDKIKDSQMMGDHRVTWIKCVNDTHEADAINKKLIEKDPNLTDIEDRLKNLENK